MQVDLRDNLDTAWLQDVLLRDARVLHALRSAGLHAQDAMKVLQLRALDESNTASVRVDISGNSSFWLNDLESDKSYQFGPLLMSMAVDICKETRCRPR
jgi:hypothetical protein